MPGTIVNPRKDLFVQILIIFLLTSLQILFNIMDELKPALGHNNRTFSNKYFFTESQLYLFFFQKQTNN